MVNAHVGPEYGKPIPFRKVPGTDGPLALEIADGRLYTLESGGLSIYDIADPKNPKKLGHVGGMGNVRQLRVQGQTAFLTSRQAAEADIAQQQRLCAHLLKRARAVTGQLFRLAAGEIIAAGGNGVREW